MKHIVALSLALVLVIGWQERPAVRSDDASIRIERAEYRRAYDRMLVTYLDGAPQVATRAALAIGRIGDPAGIAPLRAHLADASPSVRAIAAFSLGLLVAKSALADEIHATDDANSAVRYGAVDALGRIVNSHPALIERSLANVLLRVARSDRDPLVRAHAIVQLETFGHAPFASAFVGPLASFALHDPSGDVRVHAMWTLFRGYALRVPGSTLRAALLSPNELVRVEALRAYGRRTDANRSRILRIARVDPSWRVQLEAYEVLRHMRGLGRTEHLTADPPGLHLPPSQARPASGPVPAARRVHGRYAAPNPASLALGPQLLPQTAADMNGPLPGSHPRALIATTKGDVVVRLYPEWSPGTVANFLTLAARGYFDGNRWFRIVPDFVVQTGDPHGDGNGDAGYTIPAEENPLEQRSYVLSMGLNYAKDKAIRDSAGTQFYLTLSPQFHLDRAFTTFGEIESGAAVLAHLVERDRILSVRRIADE